MCPNSGFKSYWNKTKSCYHNWKLEFNILKSMYNKFCNNDKYGDKSLIVSTKKPKWPFNLFKTYLTRFQFSQDLVHWLSSICSFSELTKLSYCNISPRSESGNEIYSWEMLLYCHLFRSTNAISVNSTQDLTETN